MRNDAGYKIFAASVRVDDSTENLDRPVRFDVYGDGKLLAESPPFKFGDKARVLTADIEGRRIIELVVRSKDSKNERPVVAT